MALSPEMAALCSKDKARLEAFWRALAETVEDHHHVLYIGCGPAAPLIVPELVSTNATFHLIDIHEESIEKARVFLMPWSDRLTFEVADAAECDLPKADIVVFECMTMGLMREPHIAIWQNVARRLPDAKIVPERLDVVFGDPELERFCITTKNVCEIEDEKVCIISDQTPIQIKLEIEVNDGNWLKEGSVVVAPTYLRLPAVGTPLEIGYVIGECPQFQLIGSLK